MSGRLRILAAVSAVMLTLSCQTATDDAATRSDATTSPASASAPESESTAAGDVEGMFDVGGHTLYLHCAGTGTPTVVYMHGAIWDSGTVAHQAADTIQEELQEEYRVCVFDRRNVGRSDPVDAPQSPHDAMTDLQRLLAAADIEPPYVLLGASFGGLLSYLYANTHRDQVVAMVLLDAMFPDDLALDDLLPSDKTYKVESSDDECCTLERISHYKVLKAAEAFIGKEPAIPVIYFASEQASWDVGVPAYDEVIRDVQSAYVDRFSPGVLRWVDSPHFMEPAIPIEIADAVREVIADTRD
jgi:pimeloyl-ACP methyl ester carboxylesterase